MSKSAKNEFVKPTDNIHVVELDPKKVGQFIGPGGKHLFFNVIIPAKKAYCKISQGLDERDFNIQIHIDKDESDCIIASWNNVDGIEMKTMNPIIIEQLNKSSEIISQDKSKKTESAKKNSKAGKAGSFKEYAIKVNIHPKHIGKIIGIECTSIDNLKDSLMESLELTRKPFIKLHDDGPGKTSHEIKTKYDGGGSGIWFQIKFKHSDKVFKTVLGIVEKFLNELFAEEEEESAKESDDEYNVNSDW